MKSRYGKMPQKQPHTDDQCYISWTPFLCAAVSSLKHQPRVISGAAGATLCEYSQSDRSVLRCVMFLAQSVTFFWMRASESARMQTPRLPRIAHSFRREGQRWKDLDQRHEVGKKKWKKFESSKKKKKKKTDFPLWSGGAKDVVTREQACNKRNWVEETKVTKTRRFSTSTALKKLLLSSPDNMPAKLTVLTTLHTYTLELTAVHHQRVDPKNFSVGNIT